MRTYAIKEMFLTMQGEGAWSGSRAVFVRFAGCNIWSGSEHTRKDDMQKGYCAEFCDTAFVGTDGERGGKYSLPELVEAIQELWVWKTNGEQPGMVVFTGGEPGLQLDEDIVRILRAKGFQTHVETNGTILLPFLVDWITLSPKPPAEVVIIPDEVKIIMPCPVDPEVYGKGVRTKFVQPRDYGHPNDLRNLHALDACKKYVMTHPGWRLSLQMHKIARMPL